MEPERDNHEENCSGGRMDEAQDVVGGFTIVKRQLSIRADAAVQLREVVKEEEPAASSRGLAPPPT